MNDIDIFTLALYPNNNVLAYFSKSAERQGMNPAYYTIPNYIYDGWFKIKVTHMLEALKFLKTKYVLYTDGNDSIFLTDLSEIRGKYEDFGKPPMLVSASVHALNDTCMDSDYYNEAITHYPEVGTPYKFPHAGSFIGERRYIMDVITKMLPYEKDWPGDDAQVWHECWKEGWFRPVIDSECSIFQVGCRGKALSHLVPYSNRLYNTVTNSFPCILHDNGGYADPITGKLDRMRKWYEAIYDSRTI